MKNFDTAAESYDRTFTNSSIGKAQRARVYHWLEKLRLEPSAKIFEVNCGTGEDAKKLHQKGYKIRATDASPKMVEAAREKSKEEYPVYQLDLREISKDGNIIDSNLIFSNFGGLNCLSKNELEQFVQAIVNLQDSGDYCVFVLMSKFCLMEDIYHFFTFRWSKLFRRNTKEGVIINVDGTEVNTFYYLPSEVIKMFGKKYEVIFEKPVALFLPPSYLEPFFAKHHWLLILLNKLESIFGAWNWFAQYADHYLIAARKK